MQADAASDVGKAPDALLLDAALESIPYGFCVWNPRFRLEMWNKHYRDLYGFDEKAITRGMTLEQVVALSGQLGNHPGQTGQQFYEAYTAELLANRGGARAKTQETVRGGRIVQTAHVYSPRLGWVVTHEDVTEDVARTEVIQRRKRELERQNIRLDAAVNNISQGLSMFDPKGRLVICNQPYAKLYNLPDNLLRPGTLLEDILQHLFENGMNSNGGQEQYNAWRRNVIARGEYGKMVHELGGRTLMMQHHPMKDGGWVSTHEDITEQRKTEARIRHLARHDALTDLPNRMQFHDDMKETEAAIRRGEKAAVLYVDLDFFKAVNDTQGHAAGDQVLKHVAARLTASIRENDTLARLGGDEFAILLKRIESPLDAATVAGRVISAVSAPMMIEGKEVTIGASVGIALAPSDGTTTDALMKNADLALYQAKAEGRCTYHFFEAGMDAALRQRRGIEAGLRQAVANEELQLAFQPLLGLKDNRITCVEALLRWNHGGTAISPSEFIPIAEETGLIGPIGEWVLRQACEQARAWPADVRLAVNLSPVQFKNRKLAEFVKTVLAETGLEPTRLELEITESLLLTENDQTLRTLHDLRAFGIRISMDDFGTGYSSLSYLRSFPFDKIKIDRSFIRDLDRTGDGLAIVKAVIGLGHSLGMSTTAEGVETEEQLALLQAHGCDEAQGFLFSPPVTAAILDKLLARVSSVALDMRKVG